MRNQIRTVFAAAAGDNYTGEGVLEAGRSFATNLLGGH
jgi:hypothetical protein